MRTLTIAGLIFALSACGEVKQTETKPTEKKEWPPIIGQMVLPNVDSFCTFFKDGHVFDYHNESTWKFVFVDELGDPEGKARMLIDGKFRTFKPVFENVEGAVEVRHYETIDAPTVKVLMEMEAGEKGYEATPYTGTLSVIKSIKDDMPEIYEGSEVKFYGDCGV